MNIKKISRDFPDLDKVEILAKEAFPPEEYLSPSKLIEMSERDDFDFWGLYDEEVFVGFMVVAVCQKICYLFFLAISRDFRSKGYGGQALNLLDEIYPDKQQVVDFEMIDRSKTNNAQRIARKAFYVRHGYVETGKFISYRGVDYEILCKDADFEFDQFKKMMNGFNIEDFNPKYFEKIN